MIRVASLWVNTIDTEDGKKTYISGPTGPVIIPENSYISLMKNEQKRSERSPDYYLYVQEKKPDKKVSESLKHTGNAEDIPF